MTHGHLTAELARIRIAERIAEAEQRRLVRAAKRARREQRRAAPQRRWIRRLMHLKVPALPERPAAPTARTAEPPARAQNEVESPRTAARSV